MADFNQQSNNTDDKTLRTIFVRNISYSAQQQDLYNVDQFKNATDIKIPTNRETGQPKGYGFIEFATEEECANAIAAAQGIVIDNRELICQQSQPRSSVMQQNLTGQGQGLQAQERRNRSQQGGDGFQVQGGQSQGRQQGGFQRNASRDDHNSLEKTQRTIFARNLSWNVTVANLYDIDHFKSATEIKIPTQRIDYVREANDPSNRKPRGFAFIEFATQEECANVLLAAQGLVIDQRELIMVQSQPKENQTSGGYQQQAGVPRGGAARGGQRQQGQWNQNQGNGGGDYGQQNHGQQNYGQQNNGGW